MSPKELTRRGGEGSSEEGMNITRRSFLQLEEDQKTDCTSVADHCGSRWPSDLAPGSGRAKIKRIGQFFRIASAVGGVGIALTGRE